MFTITPEMKEMVKAEFKKQNPLDNPFVIRLFCNLEVQLDKLIHVDSPRMYYDFLKDIHVNAETLMPKEQFIEMYTEIEKEDKERKEAHLKIEVELMEYRRNREIARIDNGVIEAGVSLMHKQCCFENYIISNDTQKGYIEQLKTDDKTWFMFLGKTGTGKNHLAAAMIRERITKGRSAVIWRVKKLIDELLGASLDEKRDMLRELYAVDLLILNELGRSTDKKFFQDTFFDLFDERHENYRQTVIISNLNKNETLGMFDVALQRKLSESSKVMEFTWDNYKGGIK